jgi:hypothetical protein
MRHYAAEDNSRGVSCLFCGNYTPLPVQTQQRFANNEESGFKGSIIRCQSCGKEALYLAEEIFRFPTWRREDVHRHPAT